VAVDESCASNAETWDFFRSTVSHRNLGGLGPDAGAENMRYRHVGNRTQGDAGQARPFDLVLTATGGQYRYLHKGGTGRQGRYGEVSLTAPANLTLTFSFEDSESGEPVVLSAFHFTVLDLDESRHAKEHALVGGFDEYMVDPETELVIEAASRNRTLFGSTRFGSECDNPRTGALGTVTCTEAGAKEPHTVVQRRRAVKLLFSRRSSFEVAFEAPCEGRPCGFRNFVFAASC